MGFWCRGFGGGERPRVAVFVRGFGGECVLASCVSVRGFGGWEVFGRLGQGWFGFVGLVVV